MTKLQSQLVFSKQQQVGIVFLVSILTILLIGLYFYNPNPETVLDLTSPEIKERQQQIALLQKQKQKENKPKIYPFNPNFITDYKGYTLGMRAEEIDKLHAFRNANKWINSVQDFKRVTGVSDSLLDKISPYFKFPEWVKKVKKKTLFSTKEPKSFSEKIDLNTATSIQLEQVYGIGNTLSNRIVKYREKINGFSDTSQLHLIYGLKTETITALLKDFAIKTPTKINTINLNTASASDIATIPGISFEMAKKIWEFRVLRGSVTQFSELEKIPEITTQKLQVIKLYLSLE
jgi:DNA uptake protein ComE-like DNA-binding protein